MYSSYQYSELERKYNKYNAKIIIDYYKIVNQLNIDTTHAEHNYKSSNSSKLSNYGNGNPEYAIPGSSGLSWVPIIHMPSSFN